MITVLANDEEKTAKVVVPDYQLSLAIGKEGQNARLAARLTGFKIDIKSESQAKELEEFKELFTFQENNTTQEIEDKIEKDDSLLLEEYDIEMNQTEEEIEE